MAVIAMTRKITKTIAMTAVTDGIVLDVWIIWREKPVENQIASF